MRWGRMVGATLLTLCMLGCAANPRIAEPSAPMPENTAGSDSQAAQSADQVGNNAAGARIESIEAQPGDAGTIVTITGDHPLSYTSYDPEASRLVIDLPDADPGTVPARIDVGTPQLGWIETTRIESRSGAAHTRIELYGRMAATTRIEPSGNDLQVILEGSTTPIAAQAPVEMPAAETAPAAEAVAIETPKMPATVLTAVNVSGGENAQLVTLVGDGNLEFRSFELSDPPRLVIDVVGVTNKVDGRKIPVKTETLDQIRVSQFSKTPEMVTRVVFDMHHYAPYHIDNNGSTVMVAFDSNREVASKSEPGQPQVTQPEVARIEPPTKPEVVPQPAVVPASASLQEMGQNVVLFDHAEPKPMQSGSVSKSSDNPSMTTLPMRSFESKTIAGGKPTYRGEKISVAFRDADLREVMFFFADVMKMNVVLDPEVTGKVDIRLNQVPWDQAFQVILKNQGLDAIEEDNVVRIAKTTKLRTEAADLRSLKQAQDLAVDPVTFTRTLSYAKVQDALQVLQQVKTDRGKIVADIRTNTLIIQDIPDRMQAYNGLLDSLDTQTPQVIIEARIVEAIRSFERDLGINWGIAGDADPALGTQTNLQFPHRVNFDADVNTAPPGFPSAGSIGLMLGNVLDSFTLDIALEAFESDGKVRILSSPKIATQNNQPATIEQGVQIPVVTTTATEVDVQYVPASLRLIVTPQITAEDTVIMKVKVENNQPSDTVSVSDVPGIVTESVDTQILVRTGTTAVIGGVYKLQETDNETGIPGLRKIPFFGWLFKNKVNQKDSSELLVFITPKIVKNI